MKSSYDILGNHIRLIDTRNRESITDRVLGINIDKFFMPSVANVIGTDLSKYKLITKGKFACNPMHVGRDERLPVALYDEEEPAIVSPAYFMFEVVDNSILNEDYLMMWFRRPEFDSICWLHTDGSVRGGITWDDICRLELPIPPIEKQLEIVNSYKAITERIALKQKINDNLAEQCACVMYNQYSADLECGKPWIKYTVQDLIDRGFIDPPMDGNHGEIHPKVSDYVASGVPFIMANNLSDGFVDLSQCAFISEKQASSLRKGFAKPNDVLLTHKATLGRVAIVPEGNDYIILTPQVTYYRVHKGLSNVYLRYYFTSSYFQSILESFAGGGSTRAYIGITKQCELPIYLPCESSMLAITGVLKEVEKVRSYNQSEILKLKELQSTLIAQLSSR
ncbi:MULTISPECIES: restriction endonuclease subunit S [unclassified Roseburia]|uniref:restriction endonuclease subunit S n=3 Tax=Roseburia TaxID=841 RepID=UPI001FAA6AE2|nr:MULTISPECIES: restriction endonuclease subunit S [unclassified Roseburia]